MRKITTDEALRLGLAHYRQLHAEGMVAADIEERFTFNIRPGRVEHTLQICFWESEAAQPVVFFEAVINREDGLINVTKDCAAGRRD